MLEVYQCESVCLHLTHKQQEIYWCVLSPAATDARGLKHQTITIHNVV